MSQHIFRINLRPRFFIRIKLLPASFYASKHISSGFINAKKQALKSPLFKTYNVNLPKL
ncbi:MAG: hypothetical protein OT643_10095 [Bacteroidetes bacterium]|nr:hypothetical protein [Bacteroidota bacterium]